MEKAQWFIARYIDDLRRRETKNVGVILQIGDRVEARFLGETSPGALDGRQTRWAKSPENYKAWIRHWRNSVVHGAPRLGESSAAGLSNYFLEFGGERIAGELGETDELLESLYTLLVEQPKESSLSLARLAEATLREAGIIDRVQREVVVRLSNQDLLKFDYRLDNGAANLFKRVQLSFEDDRSWEAMHAAKWAFEQSQTALLEGREVRGVALVRGRATSTNEYTQQLAVLRQSADVIDVSRPDTAASMLRSLLHL